jgi:hypothetical protein
MHEHLVALLKLGSKRGLGVNLGQLWVRSLISANNLHEHCS